MNERTLDEFFDEKLREKKFKLKNFYNFKKKNYFFFPKLF